LVLRRATQLGVDISGFPNVVAHFKLMQERSIVKKLLAYKKEEKIVSVLAIGVKEGNQLFIGGQEFEL
jgi:hypothetical protein